MVAYLEVFYADIPMGVMSWDNRLNQGWFEFHSDFMPNRQRVAPLLTQEIPPSSPTTTFRLDGRWPTFVPTFITDNLPGPYALSLLRQALRASGKTPEQLNPLAWCALMGRRGQGAVGFAPGGYPELDPVEPVDISRLVSYLRLLNTGRLSDNRMRELLRSGLFTTTERPSALLAINDFTGAVLSGQAGLPSGFQAWTCWLDGFDQAGVPTLEACLQANKEALACGLTVLECRPLKDGHLTHVLVRRPDRTEGYPEHLLTLPAMMPDDGVLPKDSCEAVFRCLRLLRRPYTEQAAFFRRLVYHGLRYHRMERPGDVSFCCNRAGVWSLVSSTGFPPALQGGMSLNGRYRDWTLDDYRTLGISQHIKRYERIIEDVQSALTALT